MRQIMPSITELNRLLTTYISLARKIGLPPEIMDFIAQMQQLRVTVQMAIRSIQLFYTVSGPIGWLLGLGGLAMTGMMVADFTTEITSR